jgi:hypothetical protein
MQTKQARSSILSWSGLALLAGLVYELTAQAPLSVAPLCLKFGWADFRTASWLGRRDPRPERGRVHYWFFLAAGLLKTATLALVLLTGVGIVQAIVEANAGPQPQPDVPVELIEALVTAYVGYAASFLATCRALRLACRFRVKVWLDPAWHGARREDRWPTAVADCRGNRAGLLILTALLVFFVGFVLLPLVLAGLILLLQAFPPQQGVTWPFVVFGVGLFGLVGLPAIKGSIVLYHYFLRRVAAETPEEGWDVPQEPAWAVAPEEAGRQLG